MFAKKLAIAAATAAGLGLAVPAFANPPHRAPAHGWRAKHGHDHRYYGHYRPYRVVVVRPAPVYYAPPRPVVVYQPPVYVAPRPVIYGHFPLRRDVELGISVGF